MNSQSPSFLARHLFACALAAWSVGALAQVITIDQAKALAGGVTPGDTPGFPVTLSQPGSYRLNGPLSSPESTTGVFVTAPNVMLDLNGFTISGARCGSVRCRIGNNPSVTGVLFQAHGAAAIINGTVDAFEGNGVSAYIGVDLLLERVQVRRHGYCGVSANGASVIRGVIAADNVYCGIHASAGGLMQGISARDNGTYQVSAGVGSLLTSSTLVGPVPQAVGGVTSNGDNLCRTPDGPAASC